MRAAETRGITCQSYAVQVGHATIKMQALGYAPHFLGGILGGPSLGAVDDERGSLHALEARLSCNSGV